MTSPRWAVSGVNDVRVISRYAASKGYFSYRMQTDGSARRITLTSCGSGRMAEVRILLPDGWNVTNVTVNEQPKEFGVLSVGASRYVTFLKSIQGMGTAVITCGK